MRLTHVAPGKLIGKTIIYRHQFWRVADVLQEEGEILLRKDWDKSQRGRLRFRQLGECRIYPEREMIEQRYPRLLAALQWSGILTRSEAISAIEGYVVNGSNDYGPEAVAHMGGSLRAIRFAFTRRANYRLAVRLQNH